jgi:hypothetical protein
MPPLTNPKWEQFCQGVASGLSAAKSYEQAGFKPSRQNAHALLQKQDISLRISQISVEKQHIHSTAVAQAVERTAVTVESLIGHADEIRQLAIKDGQYGPAVTALKEVGILSGKRVERRDLAVQQVDDLSNLSDQQLKDRIAETKLALAEATLEIAEDLNLDPDRITLRKYIEAVREWFEAGGAFVPDLTPPPAEVRHQHMRPLPPRPTRPVLRLAAPKSNGNGSYSNDANGFNKRL